ncbi:hypothetical protein EJ994_13610 [Maribacter sp. MJ134]|uniref:tetratricopeptide repeat-containing sensor histidine kinase n=1 Tax=Maribacter sp. MJ134 TaxID=2496865 RepID=UPI000F846B88|nr:hypothetical protein [Maribacter sp. MJ134]AZQ59782.1 hypothetical protein EJ994_13610 [Maribacter sp. MJ134]
MRKTLFIVLIVTLFSCEIEKKNRFDSKNLNDSTSFYFLKSQNLNLTEGKRLKAINKAIHISSKFEWQPINEQLEYQKNLILFDLGKYDSLKIYHKKLINNAINNENVFYAATQYYLMAYYYDKVIKRKDSAFLNYNLSKRYFLKELDSSWVGRSLLNMGTIQKDQNDFFGSKETLTEALNYLNLNNDITHIVQCYNLLATNHRKLLNFEDALAYYAKAINMTDSSSDKFIYQNNLAATYIDNQQLKMAISLLDSISSIPIPVTNQKEYARVLDNLAYAKWLSGKKIEEKDFQAPLQLRKQKNDQRGQIASYTHLGEFYSKTNPNRARSYFDSVIQLSRTLKIPRAEKDALKFLMKLKPKNIVLRDRYVFLQDSLYEQELKVKTQFAKYKYDDKVTQEENARLEKENAEKELEAIQQRDQKIIYLGGFVFITTVLGLSFYGFRQRTKRLKQKSKTEKLAAINDTEAELSRKLHDDHGGILNQVMLMVQRDVDKSTILDKLELVYNQIRNFSREINTVDTGPNYWKSLKSTLEYAKPAEIEMVFDGGKELDWSSVGQQTKTILFKVLQELVINMARHSKAAQSVILFKDQNKALFIYYEDDGVGASKEALLRKNGLRNTEKRINALGGSIIFDSEEGKGFRAEIRVPKQ